MNISFKDNRLEKSLTNASSLKKEYGVLAKRLSQRIDSISAADNLLVLQSIPALECHSLGGGRKGEWAISISGNWRLVFKIEEDPIPKKEDGSIDHSKVINIRIMEIVDYH